MYKIKDESIFKAYDVRGIYGDGLDEEIVNLIGRAFGSYVIRAGGKTVVVGRDIRESSPVLTKTFIAGLLASGCDVRDMGVVVTPNTYYASNKYEDIDASAMITASHNPANYNGVKMNHNKSSLPTAEIMKLKEMIINEDFESGEGSLTEMPQAIDDYLMDIAVKNKLNRPLKLVVDPSNSVAALVMPKLAELMGFELVMVNDEIDPKFSAHSPDPVVLANYQDLVAKIGECKADIGVMYDGDADRVGFVDNEGNVWFGDKIQMLLARDILPKFPGRNVIVELKNSEAVVEEVTKLGGVPIFGQTGHTLIEEKLKENKAVLAAEMSCHYYIADEWFEFDDAIYALARVMQIISSSEKSFAELMADIPNYPATPEYRVAVPADKQTEIVKEVVDYFKDKCDRYLDIDGIRGYVFNGWFLVRSSNTQPIISVRAEAHTEADLEKIKVFIKEKLDTIEGVNLDWGRQVDEA